jgi:hypothetical protein
MKSGLNQVVIISMVLLLVSACSKNEKERQADLKNVLDKLVVPYSAKGWELYSWQEKNIWQYSILIGTNRTKTLEEVTSTNPSEALLIQVSGLDFLKLVLDKFPENETITWIGAHWLQHCWTGNYGNLQLPPQKDINDIAQFCSQKKLVLQVAE